MSDITKKIFSIEPEGPSKSAREPSTDDVIRPVLADRAEPRVKSAQEDVPKFVTREAKSPLKAPPQSELGEDPPSGAGWVIVSLGVLYLIGAGLYFGMPLLNETAGLFAIAGLALLLALPLVLLFLLWRALRHLNNINAQNARLSRAAEILVTPDDEALARTETLAAGIQTQISKVNSNLADTVEALKGVQLGVTRESQALDAAGLQLTSRSDDVGRNLTLQRQALESISSTFDTRMGTLSTQITDTGQTLDVICTTAEEKLLKASEALQIASGKMDQTVADGSTRISERITEIGDISLKLEETTKTLTTDLETSAQTLTDADQGLMDKTLALQELNISTQTKIIDLQNTIDRGNEMLANLNEAAETRESFVQSYYQDLSAGLKQSENETLAAQGKTARMVEDNLAQMRQDFQAMESDLQALQSKLNNLKTAAPAAAPAAVESQTRLNLKPLDSDFPPVEAPRFAPTPRVSTTIANTASIVESPLNLGADMELESAEAAIVDYEPDVIRRPGDVDPAPASKSKGFGRRAEKQDKSGWRWRDMLGTLDRPDANLTAATGLVGAAAATTAGINGVAILTKLQLSPSAIVDEGTVIDATQARINNGESGLVTTVTTKLPDAVSHLKNEIAGNPQLENELKSFSAEFAQMIGNTPPTAPALRAALGSPDGRAYLLAAAALKG